MKKAEIISSLLYQWHFACGVITIHFCISLYVVIRDTSSSNVERLVASISGTKRTEVLYGTSSVIDKELQFFSRAKNRVDTCMDHTRPSLALGIESIRKSFLGAKNRDIKLRYITEITTENISYCKEIMKIVHELRHLDGIKGNFMISECEYAAPTTSHETTNPASTIIFSNVKEIVEQQQYVFDTFWNKAIPAKLRIREIEEGSVL
jgi:two-component system, OmpR family, sensor histidine kinase VicK